MAINWRPMAHRFVTTSGGIIEFSGENPLGQARQREEILSAQLHAVDHMSELLQIASKSTAPHRAKIAIREAWQMTELQVQVIVEMQVQRFTQIERLKLLDQLTAIREFIATQGVSLSS